jgi:hypothetical protein
MTALRPNRFYGELAHWGKLALGRFSPAAESAKRLAREIREIMASAQPTSHTAPRRVAIVSGHGVNALSLSYDALWLLSLKMRGHVTAALFCNEGLPSCEFNFRGYGLNVPAHLRIALTPAANHRPCLDCSTGASAVLRETGSELHSLSQYVLPGEVENILALSEKIPPDQIRSHVYKDVPVGDHAFSSTLRCTLRGFVALDDPDELWIYRRQLASSMLMVDRFNRFIDAFRPDKVVGVHGVYLIHGTIADVCRTRNVGVDIYGVPYRKGTVLFSHSETYHRSLVSEPASLWQNDVLDGPRRKKLLTYLGSKATGGRDNVNYHPNPVLGRQPIIDALGLDPNKPIISLFTNVIWDAQIYYSFNAFDNVFDWVFSTIAWFAQRPDLQLIIRIHPAETVGGFVTRQPILPEIMSRFPTLPPNVFIVNSDSGLSSYTIAEMSRATLIFGTKMGLEIAYRGIPVIVAGETFNRGKGYTYDAESREEYFSLLQSAPDLPRNSPEMIERALRFAYYFFFQKMMDFPPISENPYRAHREPGEKFYVFRDAAGLLPGRDATLDVICNGIVDGSPFISAF